MSLRLVKRNKSSKAVWRWGRGCPWKCLVAPLQPPRSRQSGSPTPNAHSTGWGVGAGPASVPPGSLTEWKGQDRVAEGAFKLGRSGAVPPRLRPEGHVLGVWWQLLLSWTRSWRRSQASAESASLTLPPFLFLSKFFART